MPLEISIEHNCTAHVREDSMVGTTISHYKVLEKIGEGGMGEMLEESRFSHLWFWKRSA